ncbi:MerR family transcriptional regulator [Streptococcus suis]|nr:MerR family transcriptional regulator [Streptococcus suis]
MSERWTVKQVSHLTGLTVRTLHYYDQIGLLKPAAVADNGYRYYDQNSLARLQEIMLFRELDFPLKTIQAMLDEQEFDCNQAMQDHIHLLELQKKRIENLIVHAKLLLKGGQDMVFKVFDTQDLETYKAEVKKRWGKTSTYDEFEQGYDVSKDEVFARELGEIFKALGEMKRLRASHPDVQTQVATLQAYITDHFYTCTKEILQGLGLMYVEDKRFMTNIDRVGGTGTAVFIGQAIAIYSQQKIRKV